MPSESSESDEQYKAIRVTESKMSAGQHIDNFRKGTVLYLVEWENGPRGEKYNNSWEPAKNVHEELISDFEHQLS